MEQPQVRTMMTKQKTTLFEKHVALGAKIVAFSGWEMPLQYTSILEEHRVVRENVGIFDVSHMGRVCFKGKEAERFVETLSTNRLTGKEKGTATYTVFPNEKGGTVDDAILYKESEDSFFTVVNAGNRQKDLAHFHEIAKNFAVEVISQYDKEGILAIQGPKALLLTEKLFPQITTVKPFHFIHAPFENDSIIISRTGYTGEVGVEIYAPNQLIPSLWDLFLSQGKEYHIQPIGLGARDTLRLEMGYALYGHELSDSISALESVSSWTVKFKEREFLGKEALLALKNSPSRRRAYAAILQGKGIAREGYEVLQNNEPIGIVTSGTLSPSTGKAIALILVNKTLELGEKISIKIRKQIVEAEIVKLPFYKGNKS